MSTTYGISLGLELGESSCKVEFIIDDGYSVLSTPMYTAEELRKAIIRQIEVLSYISDDPEEVLKRFNVRYGQTD